MGWTLEQLTALEAAWAEGAAEIRIGDRSIKLNDPDKVYKQIQIIRRELGLESGGPGPVVFNQCGFGGRF